MNGHRDWGAPSDEQQPLTWLKGYPIYAAHFIVVVFVASMLVTTILLGFKNYAGAKWLGFYSDQVLNGQVWRVVTYGLWNPPSFGFVADMFMIVWFGRELEKFFGRKKFLVLYGALYLLTPLLLTGVGFLFPQAMSGETGAFALFIAFATLYPNVPLIFNILAKWLAFILVGIFTLMAIAYHDHIGLLSLWATSGFAFGFVRYEQGHFTLPRLRWPRKKPNLRVLPDPVVTKKTILAAPAAKEAATMAEVDALLDKIAKSGIHSLTANDPIFTKKHRARCSS